MRAVGVLVLAGSSVVGVAAPARAAYKPALGAVFSRPTVAGKGAESTIRKQLLDLIDHAAPGSSIRIAMYLWRDRAITNALVRARTRRNVTVQVLLNNAEDAQSVPWFKELQTRIGRYRPGFGSASWVAQCGRGWGCLGTGIHHNKFFLFSKVGGTENVVVQSSANLTKEERTDFWNNAYTAADEGLYGLYGSYFDQLKQGIGRYAPPGDDAYTHTESGEYQLYTMPSAGDEPIERVLENVVCGTDPKRPTQIRVAMFKFGLPSIAERLADLRSGGCKVRVAFGTLGTNGGDVREMERILRTGVDGVRVCDPPMTVHSKYLTIDAGAGSFEGVTGKKVVFTGSFNYMPYDLRRNDETVLRIDDAAVHDQYRTDFDTGPYRRCAKPWWEGDRTAMR